jgi:serine/threonine protein kinase
LSGRNPMITEAVLPRASGFTGVPAGVMQMPEKIGRFEISSQLAQSPFATVYKAVDSESQQTVALKVVRFDQVKDRAALMKSVLAEADQAKSISSHNIAALYGVGDEGDLLLASMEYVQGNSVATTLARHDGFSIWDLEDIARQVCQALDHAQVHKVVHQSLEPAKIMVQWDGMVKILSFGSSAMNSQAMELSGAVPDVLRYASPEQLRGETCDQRSALFSLGAVLYEMAAERKAFPGETPDQVRSLILEDTPPMPHRLQANLNAGLSALIMKAISKSPAERYQSGQELVRDLEQCKAGVTTAAAQPAPAPPQTTAAPKAFAATAGAGRSPISKPSAAAGPTASAAPAPARSKPNFAVDPMMAESADDESATGSFSEISELPPLEEAYVAQPAAPSFPEEFELPEPALKKSKSERSGVQVREAAQRAVNAIRKTPPKLYVYGVSCAVFLIALYIAGMSFYNYLQDRDTGGVSNPMPVVPLSQPETRQTAAAAETTAAQQHAQPEAAQQPQQPDTTQPEAPPAQPEEQAAPANPRPTRGRRGPVRGAPAVVPSQLSVSSTPEGAQVSFDGSALCETPCTLTGIAPGQHTVSVHKAGFSAATRNLAMLSGTNSSVSLELSPLGASLSVASTPPGAVILINGKDTGKLTPAQLSMSKPGTYTVTLRRAGYLDQSSSVEVELGQPASVSLALTHLANTDDIRAAGGKFKKVFGRGGDTADMGIVSIKTQPKGAQIMVNNRVLDKNTPFDFYLNPGTYVIDVTLAGYQSLHRVITVQEGEKLAIQETLNPE